MSEQPNDQTPVIPEPPAPERLDGAVASEAMSSDAMSSDAVPASEPPASRKALVIAFVSVVAALALVWLAPSIDPHEDPPAESAVNHGDPEDAAAVGKPAPMHYTLKDMNGVEVKLEAFKGKVVVVNFWATWCGPCKAEIPDLVALQTQYKDDLVVLGISVDDKAEDMKPYAAEYKINYPLLVGNGRQDVQDAFGPLYGVPVSVIVGRDGKIAKKHSGIASREQFEAEIQSLL
jgi:thiol-disulfide isomerase/thioredoxin